MPRITRIVASGHPYHVRQRGNDCHAVFRNNRDSNAHDDITATGSDGFIWDVRRELDEQGTCCRGEDQERISINSVCPYITYHYGPLGIPGIPAVTLFGHPLTAKWEWALLAGAFYAAVFWVARNLKRSALGRVLIAISEDEIFCQSLGKNVGLANLQSFVLGAILAAIPGALYAHYVSFIDPTSFTVHESIFILSIIIVGGIGNLWGSLAAAAFMILVPEALRFVGLPGGIAANVRQILYGAALVLVIWLQHDRPKREASTVA